MSGRFATIALRWSRTSLAARCPWICRNDRAMPAPSDRPFSPCDPLLPELTSPRSCRYSWTTSNVESAMAKNTGKKKRKAKKAGASISAEEIVAIIVAALQKAITDAGLSLSTGAIDEWQKGLLGAVK